MTTPPSFMADTRYKVQLLDNGRIRIDGMIEREPRWYTTADFVEWAQGLGWGQGVITAVHNRILGWADAGLIDIDKLEPPEPEYVVYERITNPDARIQEGDYVPDNYGAWRPAQYTIGCKLGDTELKAILRPVPNAEVTVPEHPMPRQTP